VVGLSLSIRYATSVSCRGFALLAPLVALIVLGSGNVVRGADGSSIAIEFRADLPGVQGLGVSVSAEWGACTARLGLAWTAERRLPDVSLESAVRRGSVSVRGRIEDLLDSPTLAAALDIEGTQATARFDMTFAGSPGGWVPGRPELEMTLSPTAGVQIGTRLRLGSDGLSLSAFDVDAESELAGASYRAEWDDLRRLSTSYSIAVPSLHIEWTSATHATATGRETSTSWHAILPESLSASTTSAGLPIAVESATALRDARPADVLDSTCSVCNAASRADSTGDVVDFGEVMVGETAESYVTLNCTSHVFCWLDDITQRPRAPFGVDYAPIGLTIPIRGQRDIVLHFAPTAVGRYDGTMTIRYCFATWHEREDEPLADQIGAVEGYYTRQCTTVTIPLTGIALAKPEARVSYSPDAPVCGHDVQFDGSASFDPNPEGIITRYAWDFGDNETSSEARPVHRFARSGTYRIQLTVWDNREMASDPYVVDVDVTVDLVEAAAATGAAAAAGWATQTLAMAPPLLAAAASGTVLAVASIIHELGPARFPIDQLILRFPDSWDLTDVEELVGRNIPGSRVIGYFSTLHAFLIQIPMVDGSAADAADELESVRERLARILPSGAELARNYVGSFEGMVRGAGPAESYDLEALAPDLRVAYDAVRASEAWRRIREADVRLMSVRVAVIDSGIRATHEEFVIPLRGRSYVAVTEGEVRPWFEDTSGHGTQISGIIGAENGTGRMNGLLSGGAGHYEMQVYRVAGDMFAVWDSTRLAVSRATEELGAWKTAAQTGAGRQSVVVNISLGWDLAALPEAERVLARNTFRDVFEAYPDVLFVASAGNGDTPDDLTRSMGRQITSGDNLHAPGGIGAANNLSVAATNPSGTELASWSNYGSAIDMAAPGQDVYTTDDDGGYVWRVEGTSYATAMVSGAATVIRAIDPKLTPAEVKGILMSSPSRVAAPDGTMIPVLDFADAVSRALESRQERNLRTLWWSAGAALGALALGLLLFSPF